jgi:HicB family
MDLTRHVTGIQSDLAAAAALGGEDIAEAGRRLSEALESSIHLRLLDLLTDASLSVGAQLEEAQVEVRMLGREPDLVVVGTSTAWEEPAPGDDLSARITLRLPETLKAAVEAAAAREGVSTNAWIVRALSRSIDRRPSGRRAGNRLQGFARS